MVGVGDSVRRGRYIRYIYGGFLQCTASASPPGGMWLPGYRRDRSEVRPDDITGPYVYRCA